LNESKQIYTSRQLEVLEAVENHSTRKAAADFLGVSQRTLRAVLATAKRRAAAHNGKQKAKLEFDPVPDEDIPVADLWNQRAKKFAVKEAYEEATKLRTVKVKAKGPIGILHFGDPHVDDDGTNVALIERHCKLVRETDGLFGANIGDTTNNWIGRLARLYGDQATSAEQAWKMAEYFLHFCPGVDPQTLKPSERKDLLSNWLYLIGGNHDCWSGAGDPLKWILRQADARYERSQVRLNLVFPGGRECRINARHDFKGTSQWNPAHGSMKASQMGFHDHILVNGHKHKSGYGLIKDPANGTISHCIQVGSYKVYDTFAKDMGFLDQHISPAVVTIIDPDADNVGFVWVGHDIESAVDYLKFKRRGL